MVGGVEMFMLLPKRWGRSGNDSYTKLLLHCNGDDAGTTFKDSSRSDHTVTANGNAQLDTAQKKFGASSALFDGTGDYLSIADHADWNMGSGKFTIDFWIRLAAFPTGDNIGIFENYENGSNRTLFYVTGTDPYYLRFYGVYSGSTIFNLVKEMSSPSLNTWYHIALIRGWGGNANDFAITVNGVQIGNTTTDTDSWPDFSGSFNIGINSEESKYLTGWIDEFRVSKGIARWTANFTAPTSPYR